ncbi:MAG: hypothetical protein FWG14_03135 [Peptococcaceae bacterium]|nr:hypothetical protein [Peptococcaceae bacterium]
MKITMARLVCMVGIVMISAAVTLACTEQTKTQEESPLSTSSTETLESTWL